MRLVESTFVNYSWNLNFSSPVASYIFHCSRVAFNSSWKFHRKSDYQPTLAMDKVISDLYLNKLIKLAVIILSIVSRRFQVAEEELANKQSPWRCTGTSAVRNELKLFPTWKVRAPMDKEEEEIHLQFNK